MSDDMTIQLDSEEYVVRQSGDVLEVGRAVAGEVTWLDEVPLSLLPDPAREALERGDTSDAVLQGALRGVIQAEVERGG